MVSDPISDLIIQLKNAGRVKKEIISLPYSKLRHAVADKLVAAGYVKSAEKRGKKIKKMLDVELAYTEAGIHRISDVKRLSKPGRRLYSGAKDIFRVKFGKGHLIVSTPNGILTGEEARAQNVGGEQLFMIW